MAQPAQQAPVSDPSPTPGTWMQRRPGARRLVHYDIVSMELHEVLACLPPQREKWLDLVWQPWPQTSLICAWACVQGPVYLLDAHRHAVLAQLQLTGNPLTLALHQYLQDIVPESSLREARHGSQAELWNLQYHVRPSTTRTEGQDIIEWSNAGSRLMFTQGAAVGMLSFAAT